MAEKITAKKSHFLPENQTNSEKDIFELDIEGKCTIKVTRQTLCLIKGSRLEEEFSKLSGKKYFIDRNYKSFYMMISYLRNNMDDIEHITEDFVRELRYWRIPLKSTFEKTKLVTKDELMQKYIELFKSEPKKVCVTIKNAWKNLEPFDIQKALKKTGVVLDTSIEFVYNM